MKRPKKAIPIEEKVVTSRYYIECPHCKTKLTGGINENIDRLFCYWCNNVIILDWETLEREII